MTDRYASFARSGPGRFMIKRLGLPDPPRLRRHRAGDSVVAGPVLLGGTGRAVEPTRKILQDLGAGEPVDTKPSAIIFDATGLPDSAGLRAVYDFFHPVISTLAPSGRVIVLGTPPETCVGHHEATAQRALEGFVRSLAKEV